MYNKNAEQIEIHVQQQQTNVSYTECIPQLMTGKPTIMNKCIDHIFFTIYGQGSKNLQKLLKELKNHHPNLKFMATFSETTVNFLDVTVRETLNQRKSWI